MRVNLSVSTAQNTCGSGLETITNVENAQANVLTGLDGNDRLDGGAGPDTLIGGLGNDTYTVDNSGDAVTELAGEGTDTVNAGASFVLSDNVERLVLTGTQGIDGTGNALDNQLTGNGGANRLYGLAGVDTIDGANGDDVISGGQGADILTGGRGADVFVFDVLETSPNRDMIRDFTHGADKIELDHTVFPGLSAVAAYPDNLAVSDFTFGKAATTASHHIIYNAGNGQLFYDADGVGGAAQVQIAMLQGKPVLNAGDFLVI